MKPSWIKEIMKEAATTTQAVHPPSGFLGDLSLSVLFTPICWSKVKARSRFLADFNSQPGE